MGKLSKAELLAGKAATRTVEIEALDGEVEIRPLTDLEWSKVLGRMGTSLGVGFNAAGAAVPQVSDIGKVLETDHSANVLAASYGLSVDEKWSEEEVGRLPAGSAEQIAAEVFDLSGVRPGGDELLRKFRRKRPRTRDRETGGDRGSTSGDASRPHAGTTKGVDPVDSRARVEEGGAPKDEGPRKGEEAVAGAVGGKSLGA